MQWTDFLPRVLPYAKGCPDALAVQHIVDAAREFAAKTLVWQFTATPIQTVAGQDSYTLQLDGTQELVKITWCEVDGGEYEIANKLISRRMQKCSWGNWCTPTGPQDFKLWPIPQLDGLVIDMDLAVKPRQDGSGKWPDDLDEHVPDIVHGAIGSLLLVPSDWANPGLAAEQTRLFNSRTASVQFRVSRNYGRSRQRARVQVY